MSLQQLEMLKGSGRGGTRKGAGRPKLSATKVIRVPTACLPEIKEILEKHAALNAVTEIKGGEL